jgi:hypothetical protein
MKYTEKELDEKVTSLIPKSILAEVKDFQETAEEEEWEWQPNTYDTLDHFIDITEGKECARYKRAITKVERSIGIMRQVKEGENIIEFGSTGSRVLKVGTWTSNKRYDELIKG